MAIPRGLIRGSRLVGGFFVGHPNADEQKFRGHLTDPNDGTAPIRAESRRLAYAQRAVTGLGFSLAAASVTIATAMQLGYLQGLAAAAKAVLPSVFATTSLAPPVLALYALAGALAFLTLATLTGIAIVNGVQARKVGSSYYERMTVDPMPKHGYSRV